MMEAKLLSILGCSSSIAAIVASATVANPDTKQSIPYPDVMGLEKVPTFNYQGIVAQEGTKNKQKLISTNNKKRKLAQLDRGKTVAQLAIERFGCDCQQCQKQIRDRSTNQNIYSAIQVY